MPSTALAHYRVHCSHSLLALTAVAIIASLALIRHPLSHHHDHSTPTRQKTSKGGAFTPGNTATKSPGATSPGTDTAKNAKREEALKKVGRDYTQTRACRVRCVCRICARVSVCEQKCECMRIVYVRGGAQPHNCTTAQPHNCTTAQLHNHTTS
jgi:hypothetical protein